MCVVNGGRRLETHGGVGIFRIIYEIQVESVCLAVCSLLDIDAAHSLIVE